MRYENYERVKNIINDIIWLEGKLRDLNDYHISVNIEYSNAHTIYSINTVTGDEYRDQAVSLVEYIKTDLTRRINVLKNELLLL